MLSTIKPFAAYSSASHEDKATETCVLQTLITKDPFRKMIPEEVLRRVALQPAQDESLNASSVNLLSVCKSGIATSSLTSMPPLQKSQNVLPSSVVRSYTPLSGVPSKYEAKCFNAAIALMLGLDIGGQCLDCKLDVWPIHRNVKGQSQT